MRGKGGGGGGTDDVNPTVEQQGQNLSTCSRSGPDVTLPIVKLVFHADTGPEEANSCNDQPLLSAVYRLHQLGHQPPFQDVALDPASPESSGGT